MTHREIQPLAGLAILYYQRPDGSHGWTCTVRNGVKIEGCNWLLNTYFRNGPVSPLIYAGLVANAGYVSQSVTDRHDSHSGWNEWAALNSPTRPVWTPGAANGGLMGTSNPARFVFTSAGSIRGAFLSTISQVGSVAAGVLYNTAITRAGLAVEDGGQLDVTFAVRLGT